MNEILEAASHYAIRDELQEMVVNDLLGPAGGPEEEVDEQRVSERYLVGMLAPRERRMSAEDFEEHAIGGPQSGEDGSTDQGAPHTTRLFPSSFGLTFTVDGKEEVIQVTARWGQYIRTHSETATTAKGDPKLVWKRIPIEGTSSPISLQEGAIEPWSPCPDQPDVIIRGEVRKTESSDWIVSLFLVNFQREPKKLRDAAWIFQPKLIVQSPDGRPIFCKRPLFHDSDRLDPLTRYESRSMAMLYRHKAEFAVGHGVSIHADPDPNDAQRATRISTRVIPIYDVPKQKHVSPSDDPNLTGLVLDMKELAEASDAEFSKKLRVLINAYANWIEKEHAKIDDPVFGLEMYRDVAEDAIKNCSRALDRIQEGLDLLEKDPRAAEAFRFANRAMWLQRIRSIYSTAVRRGEDVELNQIDKPVNRSWFPFQLAFILLNLASVTNLHHPDRSDDEKAIADLLWFPTGGGKTEAYLGLTAYVMALRRLQGDIEGRSAEHGMAVLMRYTLRLLTLQQFQRAATLICACESIRREDESKWGEYPFRLGLWVGQRTTPNSMEQSQEAIRSDHGVFAGTLTGIGTPAQITYCPWCGHEIKKGRDIRVNPGTRRTLIYCGDSYGRCLFSQRQSPNEGLPAFVVDEDIYRNPPSLLIATVDKFAQMPWNGAIQTLFGQVTGLCPRHGFRAPEIEDEDTHRRRGGLPAVQTEEHPLLRPPDLIIQDELHLISGPLGSLVGLYETAIDRLCSWHVDGKLVKPKIIASTATIRRARDQIHQVFQRRVELFPPQGTDIRDNFFSRQEEPDEKNPGRRYLGICASGRRLKAAEIRVYVALLATAQTLYKKYGKDADPWMTLVGYFNSIRELGGARRLVEDDIRSRLRLMDRRGLSNRNPPNLEELTSRMSAANIPRVLDQLEEQFDPNLDSKQRSEQNRPYPIDVLLATNMISVGVDVKRLGLMVVTGQPKTTAEYIQATSRIGRSYPGLVCTIYNWSRPRDLSHYERFEQYHATFYQQVEALSVTPYSQGALNRGISALLVSMVRLMGTEFNENSTAQRIDRNHPFVKDAIETIIKRGAEVIGEKGAADDLRKMLNSRLDQWSKYAQNPPGGSRLGYRDKKDGVTKGLLRTPGIEDMDDFTCLTSLRDVEPNVSLILKDVDIVEEESAEETQPPSRGN